MQAADVRARGPLRFLLIMLGLFALLVAASAGAQEKAGEQQQSSILDAMRDAQIPLPGDGGRQTKDQTLLPAVWCVDISDQATQDICWKAYRSSLDYYTTGLEHRTRVFYWQHLSTRIIFFVVIGLVLVGVYFAWVQFRRDMASGAGGSGAQGAEQHEVELSTSGIKVRSSVLGVIILALSIGFFYLYLVFVYPIQEIF